VPEFSSLLLVLSEAVLVILIDHPPPSGYAVFSEIGAPLDFDYRFAEHRFAEHEHEHEHDWAEVGPQGLLTLIGTYLH
jgi:hypothetical protein